MTQNPTTLNMICSQCHKEDNHKRQGWHLYNYFGLNGYFCHKCYQMVKHYSFYDRDSNLFIQRPSHPVYYKRILDKQKPSKDRNSTP